MAKIVNLRREKKRRARAGARAAADANATRHGTSAQARRQDEAAREKARRALEGHRLDDDGD